MLHYNLTQFEDHSFSVAGSRLWNSLLTSLRRTDSELCEFKRLMKMYLFRVDDTAAHWGLVFIMHCV